jgi:hypothetical protein
MTTALAVDHEIFGAEGLAAAWRTQSPPRRKVLIRPPDPPSSSR